jgi:hypothetical protein
LFLRPTGILDSVDRTGKKRFVFEVNHMSFSVSSTWLHRKRFSAGRKGRNDWQYPDHGRVEGNWGEALLMNLARIWLMIASFDGIWNFLKSRSFIEWHHAWRANMGKS